MKIFKKLVFSFGIILIILLVAIFFIPRLFKDEIKIALDGVIAENVNADVVFDVNNFEISLFRNFPRLTAEISELAVINRHPFDGESLFQIDRFDVEINLYDIIFDDQIRVSGISLVRPQINVKVLADGTANYDITIPSSDSVTNSDQNSKFSVGIDHLSIVDGYLNYEDKSIPYLLTMKGLNHTSSGDLTQDIIELKTHTLIDSLFTSMGKTEFLSNKKLTLDAIIAIDENFSKYSFMENKIMLNDFTMNCDGWVKMNPDNFDMDVNFSSPTNTFKSLLSLVPRIYTKDFEDIETKGQLSFLGFVKGVYTDSQMPSFQMVLKVDDSFLKYPTLPKAISNINIDMLVDNKDGVIDNTIVNLKSFHADFGDNPLDAKLLIQNLKDYRMDGEIKGRLNMEELSKMFPMDGLTMKGDLSINALVNGVYDSIKDIIPSIDAVMSLKNGFVKSTELPVPLENLNMNVTAKNESGKIAETTIAVNDFSMILDGEKLTANMILKDLSDYTWNIKANGSVDLEKITKIFPLEGMKLAGKVKADIETKGKMSAVTAKKYDQLPTKGDISVSNFKYLTEDYPEVSLHKADISFDPKTVKVKKLEGKIGKSDFTVVGSINNLMGYVFNNTTVRGTLNLNSKLLDLNEFRSESTDTSTDTTSLGVIPIPENIDFKLKSSIESVKFMDYDITKLTGDVILKNSKAQLEGLKFNMLDGAFVIKGSYSTLDLDRPKYSLGFNVGKIDIQKVASSFSIVNTYAPIAKLTQGNFSTNFTLDGELDSNMNPNLNTLNGGGLINIGLAKLNDSKFVSNILSLAKLDNIGDVSLRDVLMKAKISNGRMSVEPFNVAIGDYSTTVYGSIGVDQSLDYNLKMLIPAGQIGSQIQGFLNSYSSTSNPADKIPVSIAIKGTFTKPIPKLIMTDQKKQVNKAVKNFAKEKAADAVKQISSGTDPTKVLKNILKVKKSDSTVNIDSTDSSLNIEETAKKVEKQLNNALKGLFKKKDD